MAGLILDGAKLEAMLRGPQGVVSRYVVEGATLVQVGAKRQVGKDTHRLEMSLGKRPYMGSKGPGMLVGTDTVPYALDHHQGTRPHLIRPKKEGGFLRFPGRGGIVFAPIVHHPGTRPNHYLTDNLHLAFH